MEEPATQLTPPPLTRWQWMWRNLVVVAVGGGIWASVAGAQWEQMRVLFWLDLLLGVVSLVLYQFRRRWPFPIALTANVIGAVSASSTGVLFGTLISLATRRRWREILPVAVVNVVGGQLFLRVQPASGGWFFDIALTISSAAIAVALGLYIGARRDLIASLRDRAERAEREQALRMSQAQAKERARIAREMHDVLAHRISLVAMHAGALAYRKDLTQEETTETAEVIQANAHQALTDLREILGLLRQGETDSAPERPQPTLKDLPALIAEESEAGAHIRLSSTITALDEIPEAIGRNAYRMIQECLTNARKHAPDTTVDILVEGRRGTALDVRVENPLRIGYDASTTPGAGLGLIGLAERAALAGGRLDHKVTRQGVFVVRASLPWPA